MRFIRLILLAAGGLMVVLFAAVAVAFNSTFQTWLARRVLASRPEIRATVGSVSAGTQRVVVRDLRFEQGGAVVTVPSLEIDLPLSAAGLNRRIIVSRFQAKGLVVDGSKSAPAPATKASSGATPTGPAAAVAAGQIFAGVFAQLRLPVEVSLDGVEVEGEVILPDARGRAKITLTGGGFRTGREGQFHVGLAAGLSDPRVSAVEIKAMLVGEMDTPRSFARLALKFEAKASGSQFPAGVTLVGDCSAARGAIGESYAVTVVAPGREILNLRADFPRHSDRLSGTWKLNLRGADVVPFSLGVVWPEFSASGEGHFYSDVALTAIQADGRLTATVDRLQVIKAELAVLGEIKVETDFEIARRGGVVAVQRLVATLGGVAPVATVKALQAFEFSPATGAFKASDSARDLVGLSLHGVPVAWAGPFLKSVSLSGSTLQGELVGSSRGGGLALRSTAPLTARGISVNQGAAPVARELEVSLNAAWGYNPQGWQAQLDGCTVQSGGATVLTLESRAGQLAGDQQPLKATGRLRANLPAVLAQPIAAGALPLTSGDALIDFAASLGTIQELQAKVELTGLATVIDAKAVALPALTADLRADIAADGKIAFSVPLVIDAGGRKSDLVFSGTHVSGPGPLVTILAEATSNQLVLDDVSLLAGLASAPANQRTAGVGEAATVRRTAPPWAGLGGAITLRLRRVVYSETFAVENLGGRIEINAGMVKLEGLQAGWGENGRAQLSGALTFDAGVAQPYALGAELAVKEFDPGPLLRGGSGDRPPTVEGKFEINSRLSSRAVALDELAAGASGEFQLTSKGGVFRGLPASAAGVVEHTGRVAGIIASAGSVLGGLAGRKENATIASKAQAVAEFARGLNPIAYDQLSVVISRDAALNTTLRDFALISPEVRLTGGGMARHRPDTGFLQDPLALEFKLRARGRQGALLKYLGALESAPDDLGYAACTLPIRVSGTLGQPDSSDLNIRLAALALEKAGVTEKASELFNKLIGGGK